MDDDKTTTNDGDKGQQDDLDARRDQEGIYADRGKGDDDQANDDDKQDDKQDDQTQDDDKQDDDKKDDSGDDSGDDKAGDDKDGDDGDDKDKKSDDDSPYADLSIPDGVQIDEKRMGEFTALAAELELKPEQVQKLLDLGLAQLTENSKTQAEAAEAAVTVQADQWYTELEAHLKENKMDLKKVTEDAQDAIERFGGTKKEIAQLKELFAVTGIGNHPLLVPLLARAGAAIQEDTTVTGDGAGDQGGGDDTEDEGIYKGKTY